MSVLRLTGVTVILPLFLQSELKLEDEIKEGSIKIHSDYGKQNLN